MQAHIKLGRIFGIQIGLHFSWILIALLITLSLAAQFSAVNPDWGTGVIWATAIVTGMLFFTAIILHELSHALVARLRGLPVKSITLFALGGVALIEKESADAATEFWVGIAGPIMSVVIGFLCLLSAALLGWSPESQMLAPQTPVVAALVWLGYINIALAVFNMLPGFPLDGGRILRAVIWWITGDVNRSTRIAARVGQFVATFFIVWGVFQFFFGAGFSGLWIAFIGWFLLNAAGASHAQVEITQALKGLRVGDVMRHDFETLDGRTDLQTFVNENLLKTGSRCYFVVEDNRLAGLITPHEVKEVPRNLWAFKRVEDVMLPLETLKTITPDTPVTEALETLTGSDVNQLPVVVNGQIAGVISRNHILEVLKTRSELAI
ncbi:MAG TPA: site-2 protease family protein [Pyrinomonadaceae bacterium]|nr:site-2 protease family protein [Pyrinomonadaceae bacterium]